MGVGGQPTLRGSSRAIPQPHLVILGAGSTVGSHCLLTCVEPLMNHFLRTQSLLFRVLKAARAVGAHSVLTGS